MGSELAVADVLRIEAVARQFSLSRFSGVFSQSTATDLGCLHFWAIGCLPAVKEGNKLGQDSCCPLQTDIKKSWPMGGLRGESNSVGAPWLRRWLNRYDRRLLAAIG
jgi:hypothetical protein